MTAGLVLPKLPGGPPPGEVSWHVLVMEWQGSTDVSVWRREPEDPWGTPVWRTTMILRPEQVALAAAVVTLRNGGWVMAGSWAPGRGAGWRAPVRPDPHAGVSG